MTTRRRPAEPHGLGIIDSAGDPTPGTPSRLVARCACGWVSEPMVVSGYAHRAFSEHAAEHQELERND